MRSRTFTSTSPPTGSVSVPRRSRRLLCGDDLGLPHGVPVAIKDLRDDEGMPTTRVVVPYEDKVTEADDVVVDRLLGIGVIVLGKTNIPEYGYKSTTDDKLFGPTGTPFDPAHVTGESSGGSSADVADGLSIQICHNPAASVPASLVASSPSGYSYRPLPRG